MPSNHRTFFLVCWMIGSGLYFWGGCGGGKSLLQTGVYVHGTDGYHTYRIPALLTTPRGTLLAFCEGRKNSVHDTGDIDMLVKRSEDGGQTWSGQQVIWDDGGNTCGNPCAMADESTGIIWLLMTWNRGEDKEWDITKQTSADTRRVFVTHSDDDGRSWLPPREITEAVKKPHWTWYATGPGVGIQLRLGAHKGRLVIPCDHKDGKETDHYNSHIIFSDDHGKNWQLGGWPPVGGNNECQVVELSDGRLMLNMRNYHPTESNRRSVSISSDGGMTWSEPYYDPVLIEPICQASLIRYAPSDAKKNRNFLLFSNPASRREEGRKNMTIRLSRDEGQTWPEARTLHAGPAAYSCLAVLPDGLIGCLYEGGAEFRYDKIIFARFPIQWLEQDKH